MKVEIEANKLETPTIEWLSLVERGANRAPIKMLKNQKGMPMFNLDRLFNTQKGDKAKETEVAAIAVHKGVPVAKAKELLAAAGFSVEKMVTQKDGTQLFSQSEDMEGAEAVQVNDVLVLVTKNSESIPVAVVKLAAEVLKNYGQDEKVTPAADAKPAETNTCPEGSKWSEPEGKCVAVAAEEPKPMAEEKAGEKKADCGCAKKSVADLEADEAAAKAKADADKAAADAAVKAAADEVAAKAAAEAAKKASEEAAKKQAEDANKALAATIAEAVAAAVKPITEVVGALKAQIVEVEKVAKATQASVRGRVVGADPAADAETRVTTKSDDGDEAARVEIHDTAYQPGVRKQTLGYRQPNLGLVKNRR